MNEDQDLHAAAAAPTPVEPPPSLKRFLLQAMLWLPLAFFLWYVLRSAVVWPATRLAGALLTSWLPDVFKAAGQDYEHFSYVIAADVAGVPGLPAPELAVTLEANALMYCYGVAVLAGLVMATPLDWKRTFAQLGAGLLLLVPAQAFSLVGDALKTVAYDLSAAVASGVTDAGFPLAAAAAGSKATSVAQAALAAHGLGAETIGLWYQFGYLILPPIVPVVTWILFNRRFIESLGARLAPRRGTARRRRGPSAP
jgi:hypothetical protein